jgi:hypothetical protein
MKKERNILWGIKTILYYGREVRVTEGSKIFGASAKRQYCFWGPLNVWVHFPTGKQAEAWSYDVSQLAPRVRIAKV